MTTLISAPGSEIALSAVNLGALADRVRVPHYDRSALKPGVVHLGVGGFHRAHQARYFDEIAERGLSTDWGITGAGLHHPEMGEVLTAQDCLYTVVERAEDHESASVIGAMTRYLYAPDEHEELVTALADPDTHLMTLTITGNGYHLDADGVFDTGDPTVAADLEDPSNGGTVFGILTEALRRRRDSGAPPLTVLSCDNMQGNGAAARKAAVAFAEASGDAALARWIDQEVAFPGSMVDRITPETSEQDRDEVMRRFGIHDRWPIITEPFCQWIVEEDFAGRRPPLDEVGAQFVSDVAPYERMKTRLLNASHCALGYLGWLVGLRRTDEVLAEPVLRDYVVRLMRDDIVPLLPPVPGIDLEEYQRTLVGRLANPKIADQLTRLCRRGSTKMPTYLLPSLCEAIDQGRPHALLTLAVAGWARYLRGHDLAGEPIELTGTHEKELHALAREGGPDARALLTHREVFGDLADRPGFSELLSEALGALDSDGPLETLHEWLTRSPAGPAR